MFLALSQRTFEPIFHFSNKDVTMPARLWAVCDHSNGQAATTADCLSQKSVTQCAVMLSNESVHCDVVHESVVKLM